MLIKVRLTVYKFLCYNNLHLWVVIKYNVKWKTYILKKSCHEVSETK